MADNVVLDPGAAGDTIAADDIAGVKHQRVKVEFGADGSATDVSATNPLPIEGADAENAAITANPLPVGGRYDATPRTLGDGDAGAIALDADGAVQVSDGGNALTVDGTVTETNSAAILADTAAIDTNAATLAGAVAGTEVQVDVVAELPAGTQNIGDVDVASMPADTFVAEAGALGKGVLVQGDDGTDRQNVAVDTDGHVQVDVLSGGSGVSHIDDAAFTVATDDIVPIGGFYNTGADAVEDGDAAALRMSNRRVLYTQIRDAAGAERGVNVDASNQLAVAEASAVDILGKLTSIEVDTDKLFGAIGTDESAGPTYAMSVAGTESDGTLQELRTDSDGHLQVDVLSGGGSGTEYTEDVASSGGESGPCVLGVRQDADTSPVSATGDFHSMIFDALGNLKVNVKAGAAGGVSHIDDAAFTPATDDVVPAAGMFNDTAPDSVDEGDAGVVRMSANRNLYSTIRDAGGNERGANVDASNQLQVVEGNSAAILADTAAIDTNMATVAGAVAAGQMQVDIVADGAGLATQATLATIDADTSALAAAASGAELLIAGGATQTNDVKVSLDGENVTETNSAAILADTAAIDTNCATVAGAVAAGQMQVDIVAALPAGTQNIGDVDVATQPARDRTTDNVGVALQTDAVMADTTVKTPQFAVINGSTSGNNTLVAAGTGKIRVLSMVLSAHGNVNVTIQSGAGGTAICGPLAFDADTQPKGLVLPFSPAGHFETASATLLNMNLDAAIQVAGSLVYIDV